MSEQSNSQPAAGAANTVTPATNDAAPRDGRVAASSSPFRMPEGRRIRESGEQDAASHERRLIELARDE